MSQKKAKDDWVTRTEQHVSPAAAEARAAGLRMHDLTSAVQIRRNANGYEVSYAIPKWYAKSIAGARAEMTTRSR